MVSKSVLISIQPKWCELIASGKKTIEVRKTKPKLKTPFKVYIYCTKGDWLTSVNGKIQKPNNVVLDLKTNNEIQELNGKIIGEFVCGNIAKGTSQLGSCSSMREISEYANGKEVYGWHISDLVIYDKPRELGEFYKPCIDEEMRYCPCCKYGYEMFSPDEVECSADVLGACYEQICLNRVKRPPQSWCYVESESDAQ